MSDRKRAPVRLKVVRFELRASYSEQIEGGLVDLRTATGDQPVARTGASPQHGAVQCPAVSADIAIREADPRLPPCDGGGGLAHAEIVLVVGAGGPVGAASHGGARTRGQAGAALV